MEVYLPVMVHVEYSIRENIFINGEKVDRRCHEFLLKYCNTVSGSYRWDVRRDRPWKHLHP